MADGSVKIDITADDSDVKKKLDGVGESAEEAADGVDKLADSTDDAGKGLGILDVAAGNLVAGGISSLISGIGNAVQSLIALADETREFREDMAKLDAAFTTAGHTTEAARTAYEDFYAILGESDRSVEAVNHLAELTDNTEDLSKWGTIAAGVTARFGDSLPIEGLTEAANETAKVGKVTGPLADALNWAGISEDKFNEALAKCNTEQERATLITSTLNKEYSAAAAEYNELTAETQAARRATAEMEEAQARLGAAVEPLSTGIATLKTGFLNLGATVLETVITNFNNAQNSVIALNEEQVRLIDTTLQASEKMRDMKLAADEAAVGISSNFNYTKSLADELMRLADETGRVEDADRARVEFILGELNSALGTEYSLTGNIISNYKNIGSSIYGVIEAKRAQILLAQYEEVYAQAIQNVAAQEQARADAAIEAGARLAEFEEAKLAEKEARLAYEKAILDGASQEYIRREGARLKGLADATAKKEIELNKAQDKYRETDEAVNESYNNISAYEQASTLILEGETGKAISLLNNYGNGFDSAAGKVGEAKKKEIEALKQNVKNTQVQLGILKTEYESKQGSMTEAQKKEMEKRIANAEKEAQDALEQASTLGGNLIDGIVKGANGKEWTLTGALKNIVTRGIEAAKDAAKVNSPSKKMRDEVGKPLVEGLVKGIEEDENKAIKATQKMSKDVINASKEEFGIHSPSTEFAWIAEMIVAGLQQGLDNNRDIPSKSLHKVFDEMQKVVDKRAAEGVKTLADYNAEYKQEVIDHNKELEKLANDFENDKKKSNADIKALTEKYNADIEKENQRHADSLAKIEDSISDTIEAKIKNLLSLETDYKNDVSKLWEELGKNITDLQKRYDDQLKNRTESIANSLGIWEEATKNSVKANDLKKNLKSQVEMLEDYNSAIASLEERGINADFINELKEMGVGATGEIEALAKMTDSALSEYVSLWEEKNALAHEAAVEELEPLKAETEAQIQALADAALNEYAKLRTDFAENSTALMEELKAAIIEAEGVGYDEILAFVEDYISAGEDLMDGVIIGITNMSPFVSEAVSDAVNRAIEAAKEAAGIHSPSKVMQDEVGKQMGQGFIEGWHNKIAAIKKAMSLDIQNITASVRATVGAENARYGYHAGVADNGMSDLTRAVGVQTAGITSLAGELNRGTRNTRPVVIELNGREVGRTVVDLGGTETTRVGGTFKVGGAHK